MGGKTSKRNSNKNQFSLNKYGVTNNYQGGFQPQATLPFSPQSLGGAQPIAYIVFYSIVPNNQSNLPFTPNVVPIPSTPFQVPQQALPPVRPSINRMKVINLPPIPLNDQKTVRSISQTPRRTAYTRASNSLVLSQPLLPSVYAATPPVYS